MTATDELRRLLDERGVKYDTHGERYGTWYDTPLGGHVYVPENNAGYLHVKSDAMTPEQAIAATLGAEPDDATMVRMHDKMNTALIKYEQAQGIERREGDGKDVVPFVAEMHRLLDEAATLGNDGLERSNNGVADALQAKVKAQSDHINKLRGEYKALDEQMERRCAEYRVTICKLKAELDAATLGNDEIDELKDDYCTLVRENKRLHSCLSDDAENAKLIMGENEQLRELLREMWTFTELVDVSMRLSNGHAWNAAGFERRMSELGVI